MDISSKENILCFLFRQQSCYLSFYHYIYLQSAIGYLTIRNQEQQASNFLVQIERPEQNYQRTTLLDRDALEELLATDDVRERVLELLD